MNLKIDFSTSSSAAIAAELCKRLEEICLSKNISQAELARQAVVSRSTKDRFTTKNTKSTKKDPREQRSPGSSAAIRGRVFVVRETLFFSSPHEAERRERMDVIMSVGAAPSPRRPQRNNRDAAIAPGRRSYQRVKS